MNVVPGMVTQFAFTPTVTSDEIRETEYMRDKIARIQDIRRKKNEELVATGQESLRDYEQFEYYLLCNKICGVAHYNMQMKVVVETQEEFDAWMAEQEEFINTIEPMEGAASTEDKVPGAEVAQVEK